MDAKGSAGLNESAVESHAGLTSATEMRTHMCGELRAGHAEERVRLCGWVASRRDHGEHLAFVDLRDHSGVTQCVVSGSVDIRTEWVVRVEGTVRVRPAGKQNHDIPTGEVELADCEVEVLARQRRPRSVSTAARRPMSRSVSVIATWTCADRVCRATCA